MTRVRRNGDEAERRLERRMLALADPVNQSEWHERRAAIKDWIRSQTRSGALYDLRSARAIVARLAAAPGNLLFEVMRQARTPAYILGWVSYCQDLGQVIPDLIPHVEGPRYTWDVSYEFPGVVTLMRQARHRQWLSGHHTNYWITGTPMWDGSEDLTFGLQTEEGEHYELPSPGDVPWSGIEALDAAVWEHFAKAALPAAERLIVDRMGMNPSSSDERAREAGRRAAAGSGPAALAMAAEAVRRADPELIVPTRFLDPYPNMRIAGFFFQAHSQPFLDVYLIGNRIVHYEQRSGPRSRTRGGKLRPREHELPEHPAWVDEGSQWTFSAHGYQPALGYQPEDDSYPPFTLHGMSWPPPDYWWAIPQVQQWARTFAARQVPIVGAIRDRALQLLGPELNAIRASEEAMARHMPVRTPYPSSSFSVYGDGRTAQFHFNMPAQLRQHVPAVRRIVEEEAARRGWRFVVHQDVLGGSNYVLEGRFPDAR